MKKNFLWGLGIAMYAFVAYGQTNPVSTLVVPRVNENLDGTQNDGGGSGVLRVPVRSQTVYASSQFPSGRMTIHELRMRPSAVWGNAFTSTLPRLQLKFSSTQAQPNQLSSIFAENVGTNETLVFDGPITLSSSFTGPSAGPKAFDIIVPLSTPFLYDAAMGNLLVELRSFASTSAANIDAGGALNDGSSRAYALNPDATTTDARDKGAEVLQLVYTSEGTAPVIISGPTNQTVTEGANVTFTVNVSGSLPLSYQWSYDGGGIDGATASSLTLTNVQLSQAGSYSVTVSNAYGTATSSSAQLTVNAPPPQADYDLSRDFSGSLNPNGVWSFGWEGALGGGFNIFTHAKINIADGGVPIQVWDIPDFVPSVLHNASSQTGTSDGGQAVYPPGTTWFYPGSQGYPQNYGVLRFTVPNGGDGTYRLDTSVAPVYNQTQGDTDFHVLRNGAEIYAVNLSGQARGGYTNELALAAGDTIDFAIGRGADNSFHYSGLKIEATLDLVSTNPVPPTIVGQPQSQTVTEGANVTFTVSVSGSLPLSYQWSYNGSEIDGATGSSFSLNNVQLSQAGSYSVTVSNAYGTATSSSAQLTVNARPPQADYDLSRDFSGSSNPNGVWSFGWEGALGGGFNIFTHAKINIAGNGVPVQVWDIPDFVPVIEHNATTDTATTDGGQGNYPPGTTWFFPGSQGYPQNYGVIRFTVPNSGDGTYDLATTVRPAYDGSIQGDTDFHVLKNGVELFGRALAAGASAGYSNSLALAAGETIDFVIGRGADNSFHGSGLKIEVTLDQASTNPVPPTIVSQPQSQTVNVGATASLGVGVRGSLPLSYQWQFNGADIANGTHSTLVLEYVQQSNAGAYQVFVSNAYGSATSTVATVSVTSTGAPPTISSQPSGGQRLAGTTVTLTSQALGTAPLHYQWYYNGELLAGETSNSLVLSNVQTSQSGSYWVVVTNAFGSATSQATALSVVQSTAGGTVIFSNGTNSLVYDVDGITRLPAGTAYLAQLYAGPDANSLQPVGAAVGLWFPGRFNSGSRTITTVPAGAVATVQVKVWQTAFGSSYEEAVAAGGKAGASAVFTVTTGGAGSPPGLPAPLTGLQSFSLMPGAGTTPPSITAQPASQTIQLGQNASFQVTAEGVAPLLYQWRFNGAEISGATGASLNVTNASDSNAGSYTVVVRNNGGAVTSQVATLTVETSRILATGNLGGAAEGDLVAVPINLISQGDVGGMTFVLRYNPDFLSTPQVTWGSVLDGALREANQTALGELRFVFAFGSGTVPAGTQSLAVVSLRARTVIDSAESQLSLQIVDVSSAAGDPIVYGSAARSGSVSIVPTSSLEGDNNANGRLDVGDATLVLRLLALLDTTRSWDISQNDLNHNGVLDSGDAVKILRAAAGIGAPPVAPLAASGGVVSLSAAAPAASGLTAGSATLVPDMLMANPGSLVTVQLRLQGVQIPIAGASFTVNYPANVLRFRGAQDHRVGALVPRSAAPVWNVSPSQNNYGTQNGQLRFAIGTSSAWAASNGVLAELTFQVQNLPAGQFAWPITLSNVEITANGYELNTLQTSGATFSVQPDLGGATGDSSGRFSFSFNASSIGNYQIEASTNLINWVVLTNVVNASGPIQIADPNANQFPRRFYRARIQ